MNKYINIYIYILYIHTYQYTTLIRFVFVSPCLERRVAPGATRLDGPGPLRSDHRAKRVGSTGGDVFLLLSLNDKQGNYNINIIFMLNVL